MFIQIQRIRKLSDRILGVMSINGLPYFTTLEPPDKLNKESVSCIIAGTYDYRVVDLDEKDLTILLFGLFERSEVIVHVGNFSTDTEGCILIAESFGLHTADIRNSRKAMQTFQSLLIMPGDEGVIEIRECY